VLQGQDTEDALLDPYLFQLRWFAREQRTQPADCLGGSPVVRGDYYSEVARLLGAPAPRFVEPPPDSPAAARASADRRVRNDKLRQMLGVRLAYPTYREGLAAILDAGSGPSF